MAEAEKLLKKLISKENHWKLDLLAGWHAIQQFASGQVKIQVILEKTLVLAVPHPAIAQQLSISAKQVFAKLKEISPYNTIERLAFQVVDFDAIAPKKKSTPEQKIDAEQQLSICHITPNSWKTIILSEKELKSLDSVCCKGLKQALKNFYARCKRKEALNVQNKKFQPKAITFVDSPYINFLAFN